MNIHTAVAVMLCLTSLTTGACVTYSTHNAAIADIEATKAELSSTKTESQALTEQVTELQQHRIAIARQMEAASVTLRRATQQMEAERVALQRLNKLSRTVSQLAAQQNSLRYAIQRETKAQPKLQALVEQYKSELDENSGSVATVATPPVNHTEQPIGMAQPAQVVAQTDTSPKATLTPQAAPAPPPAVTPRPPQPASPQPPEPVEQDWISWFRDWVMSFFESIFP